MTQCRMTRLLENGATEVLVAWIPAPWAKKGTILPDLFEVISVGTTWPAKQVQERSWDFRRQRRFSDA